MRPKPVLLVGNGINRISSAGKSWEDVLKDLREAALSPNCLQGNHKPYTLYFEELYCRARNAGVGHGQFLAAVKEQFSSLGTSDYHKRLMRLDVKHVLTTNYDYTLESSVLGKAPSLNYSERWDVQESKFSLFRRNSAAEKWVWHVHGEAAVPSSIMLGHDHYVNYAGQLREYWNREVSYGATGPIKRAIKRNFANFDQGSKPYTWLDLFVRDRVHICGLSYDFSETVLWYALARRRIFAEHSDQSSYEKRPPGACAMADVIYHYFTKADDNDLQLQARLEVLESHGVTCCRYTISNNDYKAAWQALLSHLEKTIGVIDN